MQPFVSTHYNYRDHRKILVIDGRVGFTGGVNLADEYINHIQKHGRWKDAAVMLEGEAVRSLTAQFLQMWSILKEPEYEQFLTRPIPVPENAKGVAAPTGTVRWTASGWARWSTSTCSTGPGITSTL